MSEVSLTIQDWIIIGAVGGLIVWFAQVGKERLATEWDKRKIYNWLYKVTEKGKGLTVGSPINDPRWISTDVIACFTNLPKERVRYICSIHKKIRPKIESDLWKGEHLDEKWAVEEFVITIPP
jgi:hypothetical protein